MTMASGRYSTRKYSTFWPRFWAGIIDGLVFIPFDWAMHQVWTMELSTVPSILWHFINYFSFSVYVVAMHGRFGQTVGKMMTGVTVLREDNEEAISYRQSFVRESPYIALVSLGWISISYFIATKTSFAHYEQIGVLLGYAAAIWFTLEVVTMLFNDKRRALHDFIAGTVVVRGT
jgi:uncharacterized RDD family membrane protein YckC